MAGHLLLVIGIAILFYAALPALGAFLARGQWRSFRRLVTTVSHYPTAAPGVGRSASAVPCRFFGTLEAIQGDDRIWLTNGRFSVAADLRNVRVYLIPETEGNDPAAISRQGAGAALGSLPWNRIFSLPEGTPVFVGGALYSEEGRGVFRDDRQTRLLVVIHDCPKESLVLRAISGGRQRNEFMNAFTLPSVAIGALSLVLLAFKLLALPDHFGALLALTAGLAPLSPFLPPGFPLYFAYRSHWKKARLLRVQRDVVRLPLRYFPATADLSRGWRATLLPDMEPYAMIRGTRDAADPDVIVTEGIRLPLPQGIARVEVDGVESDGELFAFCGYTADGEEVTLRKPDDPMADTVLLPGDPQTLSRLSETAARRDELLSAALIVLDVFVNLPLVFILLSLVIR